MGQVKKEGETSELASMVKVRLGIQASTAHIRMKGHGASWFLRASDPCFGRMAVS